MDLNALFTNLFVSVGGVLGISLIVLRSAKKRVETYIDDAMQHRFDKKLEEYKQTLNKQFSNFENFSKKYNDCIEEVVKQLDIIEAHLKVIQEGIIKCLEKNLALDYIFNQHDDVYSIEGLSNAFKGLEQARVTCCIYLPDYIVNEIENILNTVNGYTLSIKQAMSELKLNRELCQNILDAGRTIYDKVILLSERIKEESLSKSGEI